MTGFTSLGGGCVYSPMDPHAADEPHVPTGRDPVAVLVENHRAFLRYLERRTGSRESAEDLIQDAFARNLDRLTSVPEEALVPWFYRVLRNALIDRVRRRDVEDRALTAFANELADADVPPAELRQEICGCVTRLLPTLKPSYAEILQAIDLDGAPVTAFAKTSGMSASNAGVRLHRARQALRQQVVRSCATCAEHGCLDCSCAAPARQRPV